MSAQAPQLFLFVIAIDGFPEGVGASPALDAAVGEDAGEGAGDGEKEKEDEEGVAEGGPAADFHDDAMEDIAGGGEHGEVDEDMDDDDDVDAIEPGADAKDDGGDGRVADVEPEVEDDGKEGDAEAGEDGEEDGAALEAAGEEVVVGKAGGRLILRGHGVDAGQGGDGVWRVDEGFLKRG